MASLRLTERASCSGCAAKLAPRDLALVLERLKPQPYDPNLLVGYDTADDAGVYRLSDTVALVQTVDFFTPVADDPSLFGEIAAVNALNDIYAMGGRPITALAIVCFPQKEEMELLGQILAAGQKRMNAEGVVVLGGHSIDDPEIKIGYAVTGVIDPNKIITNAGAKPGDLLVLTKPIGTGAIVTGIKKGVASTRVTEAAMATMTTSALKSSAAMCRLGAHGCTDVTGFGLLGHAYELAKASKVSLTIESKAVPLLPDVIELISQGMLTRGDKNNRTYVGDTVKFVRPVSKELQSALFDPQTAGGLLISIAPREAEQLVDELPGATIIGSVADYQSHLIKVN